MTTKAAEVYFPPWSSQYQAAFNGIKRLVTSPVCLTTINHNNPGDNHIFLTTDALDLHTGAVLSWGPDWKTAQPVAFDSAPLRNAELNYPVHEKELFAIICALKKWCVELLGAPIIVYTDHCTLENFLSQCDLSCRQACWAEYMSQFNLEIHYIWGKDNVVADALSCCLDEDIMVVVVPHAFNPAAPLTQCCFTDLDIAAEVSLLEHDRALTLEIIQGYTADPYCTKLFSLLGSMPDLVEQGGLLFLNQRLVISNVPSLCACLFHLAHDAGGHFGTDKTYELLRGSYYWPNMRHDLVNSYIPSCSACMRNKSPTTAPAGPLHPLPVPDARGDSVAIDFIGPLPEDSGFNMLLMMTDRLGADIRLVPC